MQATRKSFHEGFATASFDKRHNAEMRQGKNVIGGPDSISLTFLTI